MQDIHIYVCVQVVYFESQKDCAAGRAPKTVIKLADIREVGEVTDEPLELYVITTAGRTLQLRAADSAERDAWIATLAPKTSLVEMLVFRDQRVVHIFNVVEHGRRFHRRQVYSSDWHFCLHEMPALHAPDSNGVHTKFAAAELVPLDEGAEEEGAAGRTPMIARPVLAHESLVITRNLGNTEADRQTYVPAELLSGLLPDALIDDYTFWHNEDDTLVGYHKPEIAQRMQTAYVVRIALVRRATRAAAAAAAAAQVVRVPLKHAARVSEPALVRGEKQWAEERALRETGAAGQAMTLLNLLYAPAGSMLHAVARLLCKLDSLSHCLVWTKGEVPAGADHCDASIDLIELPRLQLSFFSKEGADGVTRLYSSSHAGMFISARRTDALNALLRGIPHGILLENLDGELSVLTPASLPFRRPASSWQETDPRLLYNHRGDHLRLREMSVRQYVYPVHISMMFLFTQTLSSALNLLLLRFLNLQYAEVFKLADCCVSDTALSPEEVWTLDALQQLNADQSPDAHACRLKISLVTVNSDIAPPWHMDTEMLQYVSKLERVSAACRLSVEEELALLQGHVDVQLNYKLANRQQFLRAVHESSASVLLKYPQRPALEDEFDSVIDKSCLNLEINDSFLSKFDNVSYKRPADVTGTAAVASLNKWLTNGLKLKGGRDDLGFLFFYEMMTGTCNVRIFGHDQGFVSACFLIRLLPQKEWQQHSLLMSILRVFSLNPDLCLGVNAADCPRIAPDQGTSMFKMMFKGMDNSFSKICKEVQPYLVRKRPNIVWYDTQTITKHVILPNTATLAALAGGGMPRSLVTTKVANYACTVRQLKAGPQATVDGINVGTSAADVNVFGRIPLSPLGLTAFVSEQTREQEGLAKVSETLPFDLKGHPSSRSHIASCMLRRLEDDAKEYAQQANSGVTMKMVLLFDAQLKEYVQDRSSPKLAAAVEKMNDLIAAMKELIAQDNTYVRVASSHVLSIANQIPADADAGSEGAGTVDGLRHELARLGRSEPVLGLDDLVSSLLSTEAEESLRLWNPFLDAAAVEQVLGLTIDLIMHVVRIGHTRRCLAEARDLLGCLERLRPATPTTAKGEAPMDDPTIVQELILKSKLLAKSLSVKRAYMIDPRDASSSGAVSYQGLRWEADGTLAGVGAGLGLGSNVEDVMLFDPRFLVFEFIHNIMLRDQQVELVQEFMSAVSDPQRGSTCQQLIMGAGKTTVVCPLLALMLADSQRLVMQVVPRALLEFSRYIMRERFSALIRKPVYTFKFDRFRTVTPETYRKLVKARNSKSVVVTTPVDIKAFFLKYVEILHMIDSATTRAGGGAVVSKQEDVGALRAQAKTCVRILELFFSGALLMDEVDLVLHPLKSELNFPLGRKEPLDLTQTSAGKGFRWDIPLHLLDALFFATTGRMALSLHGSAEAEMVLQQMQAVIDEGSRLRVLQRTPHLVLLSRHFYTTRIRPVLTRWAVFWFSMQRKAGLEDADVVAFLEAETTAHVSKEVLAKIGLDKVDDEFLKTLNLCRDLLHSILPFVLTKIDRVSYGLLSLEQIERERTAEFLVPRSRSLTAVPFVGKDVPSERSEFAHPDVIISLTILAFRYEGIRYFELKKMLRALQRSMWDEEGPYAKRPSCRQFVEWVHLAGGRVRGLSQEEVGRLARLAGAPKIVREDAPEVWPLRLLDMDDAEQFDTVFALLSGLPQLIHHYLDATIFPDVLKHQAMKISASGQELGGDMLFKRRMGFSGTPSELLPLELGKCRYDRGTDGKLQHVLTSPDVVSLRLIAMGWSVTGLLDIIASPGEEDPVYHALIDTGALVTGMSNLEVASYLLTKGLEWAEGVVFLDELDRKMILLRDGLKVVPLHQCDIHKSKRFAFYDQVHTTGMDIQHALNAKAVLTLGKDMTFRDYAQGAYRMRGIGMGQTIELFVIPEVRQLVADILAKKGAGGAARAGAGQAAGDAPGERDILKDVSAWLVVNSMRSEQVQFNMLCEHNMRNVWRKEAFNMLVARCNDVGGDAADGLLVRCIDAFLERLDYQVASEVVAERTFGAKLQQLEQENQDLMFRDEERQQVACILYACRRCLPSTSAFYVCLIRVPYLSALYVCLIRLCANRWRTSGASRRGPRGKGRCWTRPAMS